MSQSTFHIVITGITGGLGSAMARKLCSMGHIVSGCGTNRDKLAQLENKLNGGDVSFVDVSSPAGVVNWASRISQSISPPDFLLNNAALINHPKSLWKIDPLEFSRIIDVNVKGIYHTIRAFVPHMRHLSKGIIVNFSSGWGRSTSPNVAPYCASKWAVEGLTQSLAQELPSNLCAVTLNPGVIHTPMLEKVSPSAGSFMQPDTWAKQAIGKILAIDLQNNGQALSI